MHIRRNPSDVTTRIAGGNIFHKGRGLQQSAGSPLDAIPGPTRRFDGMECPIDGKSTNITGYSAKATPTLNLPSSDANALLYHQLSTKII